MPRRRRWIVVNDFCMPLPCGLCLALPCTLPAAFPLAPADWTLTLLAVARLVSVIFLPFALGCYRCGDLCGPERTSTLFLCALEETGVDDLLGVGMLKKSTPVVVETSDLAETYITVAHQVTTSALS